MSGRQIEETAYGKINLTLDVTGRRTDGYHLVRMIMQTVDIFDTVRIEHTEGEEIEVATMSGEIPAGPDNLCYRAALAMKEASQIPGGFRIFIEKRIPVAAGMAGGSADAAAVLRGIRRLCVPEAGAKDLERIGLPLGADIPYCVLGGTKLSEGIGEVLTSLPAPPKHTLVIVKPDLYVSTGWVYTNFDAIPEAEVRHPDVDAAVSALHRRDLSGLCGVLGNVLEQKTGAEYPVIGELERFLEERGAVRALMTGSGPTVFGIFDDSKKAEAAFADLAAKERYAGFQRFLTHTADEPYAAAFA